MIHIAYIYNNIIRNTLGKLRAYTRRLDGITTTLSLIKFGVLASLCVLDVQKF